MQFQAVSQTISTEDNKDSITLTLHIDDAKIILGDLLDYEKVKELLIDYKKKDSIKIEVIKRKQIIIMSQIEKMDDYIILLSNHKDILKNKNSEISLLLKRINVLEKEIKKEILKKKVAIVVAIVGPVVTAIITGIILT